MKSPFPGMDPYLENPAIWSDFHPTFINYWREQIADVLPDNYDVLSTSRTNWVRQLACKGNGTGKQK